MRIAFFVHSFPELPETFTLRQVTGLIDRGHDVRVFASRRASGGPMHATVDAYHLADLVRVLPHGGDGSLLRLLPALAHTAPLTCLASGYARSLGGWRPLVRTLATLSEEGPFDIVHCHYGDIGLHYRVAARLWRAPLVVSFYGYDCSSYPRAKGARVFQPLFAEADAIASLGAHMDTRLQALGCPANLLHRIPLSVDASEFPLPERAMQRGDRSVRLLTVARLTEKKGIAYALRALALVTDEFPDLQYDVIGDGPLLQELLTLAQTLGVHEQVRFLGARTGEYVREAMRDADLFLLPSVTAANGDQEGTPTAILEAAFSGLPVLSTMHAGIPELVLDGESGYLVPERDPAALADRLRTLLRARDTWMAMGRAGRAHVKSSHTVAIVAERLEELYRAAATERPMSLKRVRRRSARSTPSQ